MKLLPGLIFALAVTGVAHAEKFDLVCSGIVTQKLFDDAPTDEPLNHRYSLDTDASLYRGHGMSKEWRPMTVYPDRFILPYNANETTIDRATGVITNRASGRGFVRTYIGKCEKAEYTPLPTTKF